MSFDFHGSPKQKFDQQYENSQTYLVPYLTPFVALQPGTKVMEIGCGEGGVLKAFTDKGCFCLGVDLAENRVQDAQNIMAAEVQSGKAIFRVQNVYDETFLAQWKDQFDVILLKDTIEHIPHQEDFIPYLKSFLKKDGFIFFGFPPWCMPFGGHQQICRGKITSKLPYYHLLPTFLYKAILSMFGESQPTINELISVKETGISTWRFEQIVKKSGLEIAQRTFYFINPIYRYKFGLKPRKQLPFITWVPGLRDFLTTAVYYLVKN
jgi:2-polyprenyl-3-methyl-5-hydroxy-6-metoxy-1,4-benzoquinol methylase